MVETVKHAIVLLQIAKNASCPGTQGDSTDDIARVHGAEKVVSMKYEVASLQFIMLTQVDTVEEALPQENVDSFTVSATKCARRMATFVKILNKEDISTIEDRESIREVSTHYTTP